MPSLESTIETLQSPELTCDTRLAALLSELVNNDAQNQPLMNKLVDDIVGLPPYMPSLTEEDKNEWHRKHYEIFNQLEKVVRFEASRRWLAQKIN